ncbi:putative protein kinase RLK-Pelle-DLSV family [Helianthus annuus]|uniref:Gnk2-like domain-containing protein n=2 Tax=Helianthus annuus TaxID=4232 RepID=A0A9K3E8J9_HELAN|nr:cold-responsive protein kinase 1 isoform X1 [Helianthus annuus]XP_035838692.1 cold-responsive protein kinase 1 isoform X1 [Helianthus annuus]KAF5769140.1 putative protein kinase RLK-Pelle-DLSV family [Helianthus annuus]KAJ0464226.1 putative protein kinase RLK-Pelle-DLSV family [Helianthus annuus]KAJ0468683.1 putative protein kinase RLK-Pelle-DLSV family [Helianthus annuus]KAJ0485799.1 putative protein kinase RLK-Pelle-DLSV family [Helianthus annuus]KAJ0656353.1 putative protein kinase RLK-
MTVLVVLLVLLLTDPTVSQSTDDVNNTNISNHCRGRAPTSNFIRNRNSTFDEMRRRLLSERVLYARAQDLSGGDSVFAAAQCRNYLSVEQCVACFDVAFSELAKCIVSNGAYVFLDECYVRYESFDDFYDNPNATVDGASTQLSSCGNVSTNRSLAEYTQSVDEFLSDIRDATPKTSNLYVANIRQVTSGNATVYAIAQCAENINPAICGTCMSTAYSKLKECLPNTEGRFFDMVCFARYSETPFFSANQTIDITNILRGRHSSKVATIGGAIGGVVLLFLIFVSWLAYRRLKKNSKTEQEDLQGTLNYNYKDLQLATNNFSEENMLGRGGFGEVFKAIIDDNNVVAVKKLQIHSAKAKEEFENEVMLISNVHHRNLLRLLGWSSEGSNLLLVLEYMPNGSLDRFLWGAKRGTLNWNQRYEIILGIAKGLAHLHNEFHIKIIHRDIKSSNILLSHDFKAKIADFGLARFHPEDETHVNTKFVGTLGYAAPEYVLCGTLSDKVDTYSFGIVILEIISGRRCTDMNSERPSMEYLLEHAWKLYEKKIHIKFIDETLGLNQHELEHVMKIIEIALLCTQSPVSKRPTVSEVLLMLQDGQSLGKRMLTRPTFLHNQDRRILIGSSKNSISVP